ncbi:hypothetical protein [Hubei picorna-like virus 49]|uniref:hypothetical protein n=1 Tax=Hubei picorna-like virus 49 TaxID=1923130 RepID=UPI00090B1005|nr:hypothetical protein [Hubei picorna-like virus 49]APG77504.1 hypothetical protein [Hubei picorna-like virus 49]
MDTTKRNTLTTNSHHVDGVLAGFSPPLLSSIVPEPDHICDSSEPQGCNTKNDTHPVRFRSYAEVLKDSSLSSVVLQHEFSRDEQDDSKGSSLIDAHLWQFSHSKRQLNNITPGKFLCNACGTPCATLTSYRQHCLSDKHKRFMVNEQRVYHYSIPNHTMFCEICSCHFKILDLEEHDKSKHHKMLMANKRYFAVNSGLVAIRFDYRSIVHGYQNKIIDTCHYCGTTYFLSRNFQHQCDKVPSLFGSIKQQEFVTQSDTGVATEQGILNKTQTQDLSSKEANIIVAGRVQPVECNMDIISTKTSTIEDDHFVELQKQVMNKPLQHDSLTWKSSDELDKLLFAGYMPGDFIMKKLNMHFNAVNIFSMWRSDVEATFVLNGNPTLQGQLIVGYMPYTGRSIPEMRAHWLTSLPHAILKPRGSESVTIKIPYSYRAPMYNLQLVNGGNDDRNSGILYVAVLNRLQALSTTSPSISISILVRYPNSQFVQPKQNGEISFPVSAGFASRSNIVSEPKLLPPITSETCTRFDGGVEFIHRVHTAPYEQQGQVGSALENIATGIKDIVIGGVKVVKGAIGLAESFGEKATRVTYPYTIYAGSPSTWPSGRGSDNSIVFATHPVSNNLAEEGMINIVPEASLLKLCQEYNMVWRIDWSMTDAAQKQLFVTNVTPIPVIVDNDDVWQPRIQFNSTPFTFWSGSIKYKVDIVAPKLMSGAIMLVHTPLIPAGVDISLDSVSNYPYMIFNLDDTNDSCEFTCYQKNKYAGQSIRYIAGNFEAPACTLGAFRIYVFNVLSSSTPICASSVQLNIYIAAGDDFRLHGNAMYPMLDEICYNGIFETQAESGPVHIEGAPAISAHGIERCSSAIAGEEIRSFITEMKRVTHYYIQPMTFQNVSNLRACFVAEVSWANVLFPFTISNNQPPFNDNSGIGYSIPSVSYFLKQFAAVRGSLRIKAWLGPVYEVLTYKDDAGVVHKKTVLHQFQAPVYVSSYVGAGTGHDTLGDDSFGDRDANGLTIIPVGAVGDFELPYKNINSFMSTSCNVSSSKQTLRVNATLADITRLRFTVDPFIISPTLTPPSGTTPVNHTTVPSIYIAFAAGDDVLVAGRLPPPTPYFSKNNASLQVNSGATASIINDLTPSSFRLEDFFKSPDKFEEQGDTVEQGAALGGFAHKITSGATTGVTQHLDTSISAATEQVRGIINQTRHHATAASQHILSSMQRTFQSLADTIPTTASNTVSSAVDAGFASVVGNRNILCSAAADAMSIADIASSTTIGGFIWNVVRFLLSSPFVTTIRDLLVNAVQQLLGFFFESPPQIPLGDFQQQSLSDDIKIEPSNAIKIIETLGGILFLMFVGKSCGASSIRSFGDMIRTTNLIARFTNACKSIGNFLPWLKDVFGVAYKWLCSIFAPAVSGLSDEDREVFDSLEGFFEEVDNLKIIFGADLFPPDDAIRDRVFRLYDRAVIIRSVLIRPSNRQVFPPSVHALFHQYARTLVELVTYCEKAYVDLDTRVDPFSVCLYGDPGVGKSGALLKIITDLAEIMSVPHYNRMYYRNENTKFFDGYRGQFFYVIDDLFSDTEAPAIKELIQMKSNAPLILNMADLSEKGRAFSSKFLLVTTNEAYPKPATTVTKAALWRRRDVLVKIQNTGKPKNIETMEHISFGIMNANVESSAISETFTYEQFIKFIFSMYNCHVLKQDELLSGSRQPSTFVDALRTQHQAFLNMPPSPCEFEMPELPQHFVETPEPPQQNFERMSPEVMATYVTNVINNMQAWADLPLSALRIHLSEVPLNVFEAVSAARHRYIERGLRTRVTEDLPIIPETSSPGFQEQGLDDLGDPISMQVERDAELDSNASDEAYEDIPDGDIPFDSDIFPVSEDQVLSLLEEKNVSAHMVIRQSIDVFRAHFPKGLLPSQCFYNPGVFYSQFSLKVFSALKQHEMLTFALYNLAILCERVSHMKWVCGHNDYPHDVTTALCCLPFIGHHSAEYDFTIFENIRQIAQKFSAEAADHIATELDKHLAYVRTHLPDSNANNVTSWHAYLAIQYTVYCASTDTPIRVHERITQRPIADDEMLYPVIPGSRQSDGTLNPAFYQESPDHLMYWETRYALTDFVSWRAFWDSVEPEWEQVDALADPMPASVRVNEALRRAISFPQVSKVKQIWMKIKTTFKNTLNAFVDSFYNHPTICACVYYGLMLSCLYVQFRRARREERKYVHSLYNQGQMNAYLTGETKHAAKPNTFVLQSASSQVQEVVEHRVIPGLYTIRVVSSKTQRYHQANAFCFQGRDFVTVRHIFDDLVDGDIIELADSNHNIFRTVYIKSSCYEIEGRDLLFFRAGKSLRLHCDSRCHFIGRDHLARITRSPVTLVTRRPDTFELQMHHSPECVRLDEAKASGVVKRGLIGYAAETAVGHCGGVVVSHADSLTARCVAIHVAGSVKDMHEMGVGLGIVLTREDLDEAFGFFEKVSKGVIDTGLRRVLASIEGVKFVPQGCITLLGKLDPHETPGSTSKTSLQKTPISGRLWPSITRPPLTDREIAKMNFPEHPHITAISKYGRGQVSVLKPGELVNVCSHIETIIKGLPVIGLLSEYRRVLTISEAVCGVPDVEYLDPINMSSSPGYPYTLDPRYKYGKHGFVETEPFEIAPDVELQCVERLEAAKRGERVPSLWVDCVKDQRLPIYKVNAGKVRVFTICNLDFLIVFRQLCQSFCACFYQNHLKFFSAVGIDTHSVEWSRLFFQLKRRSGVGFAGDYSSYDGTIPPECIMAVCEIINAWYDDGEENALARRVLFEELVHTYQTYRGVVYQTHRGNPSGNPCTTVLNTIVGAIYLYYVWNLTFLGTDLYGTDQFDRFVTMFIYGDDNIVAVDCSVADRFNQVVVSEKLASIGITYGSARKDGTLDLIRPIEELTFLKCGFGRDSQHAFIIHPLMDVATIQELFNWTRSCDDPWTLTSDNIIDAARFLYHYGSRRYTRVRELYHKHVYFKLSNRLKPMPPWSELDSAFCFKFGLPTSTNRSSLCDVFFTPIQTNASLALALSD